MKENSKKKKENPIGGQAVIEGVMMRGEKNMSIVVRCLDGSLKTKVDNLNRVSERFRILKLPLLRGVVTLISSLYIGTKALTYSANIAFEDQEQKEKEEKEKEGKSKKKDKKSSLNQWVISFTVLVAVVLGFGLFFMLPLMLTQWLQILFPPIGESKFLFNFTDGLIRILIFFCYVFSISLMKDIRRVFQYHGAEHKAIMTYEAKEELTVENARKYTTMHPRCGTSFLLFVMIIAVFAFCFIPKDASIIAKISYRLVLIPLIAGLSYELIKFSGKKSHNKFIKLLILPGLWLQKITTREPDDQQIEVGLAALKEVLPKPTEALQ